MTVFFPLDTARLRLQGKNDILMSPGFAVLCQYVSLISVDEGRVARSTPAILAEIIKEEGL